MLPLNAWHRFEGGSWHLPGPSPPAWREAILSSWCHAAKWMINCLPGGDGHGCRMQVSNAENKLIMQVWRWLACQAALGEGRGGGRGSWALKQ